jgi:hypothetical protein
MSDEQKGRATTRCPALVSCQSWMSVSGLVPAHGPCRSIRISACLSLATIWGPECFCFMKESPSKTHFSCRLSSHEYWINIRGAGQILLGDIRPLGRKSLDGTLKKLLDAKELRIPAPVAQLDRVADFESEGCRFESCRARFGSGCQQTTYSKSGLSVQTEREKACFWLVFWARNRPRP